MKSVYAAKLEHLYSLWDQSDCDARLSCFASNKSHKYAIYGAGKYGARTAAFFKKQFSTSPVAFIDKKAESGTHMALDGIPLVTPQKLFNEAGDIPIGIAVTSYLDGTQTSEIRGYLESAGFSGSNVISVLPLDAYPDDYFYMRCIDRAKTIEVIDLLYDNEQKEQYYAYIYSRIWKTRYLAPTYPQTSDYCATDLFQLDKKDHVLDCGAFTGDTAQLLLDNFGKELNITMFEPDADSYRHLLKWIDNAPYKNLRAIPKAVGNVNGAIGFLAENSDASRADSTSSHTVDCCRIDDVELSLPPSFIKMDVEKAELDALKGAKDTIVNHRPILAISAYHKADDIYELPLFVKSLVPDYHLFFRKTVGFVISTGFVMYALPPERLL